VKVGDLVKINNELGILIRTGNSGVFGITWYTSMSSGKIEHWHGCDIEVINESR
jgi:hypothetical protein